MNTPTPVEGTVEAGIYTFELTGPNGRKFSVQVSKLMMEQDLSDGTRIVLDLLLEGVKDL